MLSERIPPRETAAELLDEAARRAAGGAPSWGLFERRIRTPREAMAPLAPEPIPEAHRAVVDALAGTGAGRERIAYVHIPYCRSICPFCAYPREKLDARSPVRSYVRSLLRHAGAWGGSPWARARPFLALHVGGGTPTAIPIEEIAGMIRQLLRELPFVPGAEVSVESTPGCLDAGGAAELANAGVNRVALGVQSFDTAFRAALGRSTPREEILARIERIRGAGIPNVCIDLMYGLPDQSLEGWAEDLRTARSSAATGASAYPFVAEPGSVFGRELAAAGQRAFLPLEEEHAMHASADDVLGGSGWKRISPVQFGDAASGAAVYVAAYGRGADVLGLGAGAHGSMVDLGYGIGPEIEGYLAGCRDGTGPPMRAWQGDARLSAARALNRLGATGAIEIAGAASILPCFEELLPRLESLGFVTRDAELARMTTNGCFWAGNISRILTLAARDMLP